MEFFFFFWPFVQEGFLTPGTEGAKRIDRMGFLTKNTLEYFHLIPKELYRIPLEASKSAFENFG
jgi:hypothetical protein